MSDGVDMRVDLCVIEVAAAHNWFDHLKIGPDVEALQDLAVVQAACSVLAGTHGKTR